MRVWLVGLAACAGQAPAPCGEAARATVEAGPGGGGNVLVLLVDDIGSAQLGPYGAGAVAPPTPALDCLCDRGTRFTQAWSAPLCSPGRATLHTGRLADKTGLGWNTNGVRGLPRSEETLGEVLGAAGYHTGYVGKWHLDATDEPDALRGPVDQGYAVFEGTMDNLRGPYNPPYPDGLEPWYDQFWWVSAGQARWVTEYATTHTVDRALAFLDEAPEPFLLVVGFHGAHEPMHEPPRRLLSRGLPSTPTDFQMYTAMIESVDTEIARLLQSIDPEVLADTTIVYASDNGVSKFGVPDGREDEVKGSLFEGGVDIPLVISGPHATPGAVHDGYVHLVDLLPTLASLVGASPTAELDGVDLSGVLADPASPGPAWVRTSWNPGDNALASAIRDDRYKVVHRDGEDLELFDLQQDPLEQHDLYDDLDPAPDAAALVLELGLGLVRRADERWTPLRWQ
jgi:arylsulfatase A-like enzyme